MRKADFLVPRGLLLPAELIELVAGYGAFYLNALGACAADRKLVLSGLDFCRSYEGEMDQHQLADILVDVILAKYPTDQEIVVKAGELLSFCKPCAGHGVSLSLVSRRRSSERPRRVGVRHGN